MRRLMVAILSLAFLIGGFGCVGSKAGGKAASANGFAGVVARGGEKVELLLDKLFEEGNADTVAGIIKKIGDEAEAMVVAAEGTSGITAAEIGGLDRKLAKIRVDLIDCLKNMPNLAINNPPRGDAAKWGYPYSMEAVNTMGAASGAFIDRIEDWGKRLDVLFEAAAPHENADTIAILPGSDDGRWVTFQDDETKLWGFKDKAGAVRIEPRFGRATNTDYYSVHRFDHIIAVEDYSSVRPGYSDYYLTKTGNIVGRGADLKACESEGLIRFKDRKTKLVGMFDRHGNVAIPAEYRYLSDVKNGLMMAFKGKPHADDDYADDDDEDVQMVIIDTLNNVVLDETGDIWGEVQFPSVRKMALPPADTAVYLSFPAKDGGYCTFTNYKKEFERWLKSDLLAGELTTEKLTEAMFDSVNCYMRPVDDTISVKITWKSERRKLTDETFDILQNDLTALLNPKREYKVYKERGEYLLNRKDPKHEKYFDNCGEFLEEEYPVFWVLLAPDSIKNPAGRYNYYRFLRTDGGYKLIDVQIRTNDLFIAAHPNAGSGDFIKYGNARVQSGDYDAAIALYSKALSREPNNLVALNNRAAAQSKKGDIAKVIEDISRLIKLEPKKSYWYMHRSTAYWQTGNFAKAITDAERAIKLDSSEAAFVTRALSHTSMGDYQKAAADLDRAAALEKTQLVFFNYSILCAYMGNESKADSLFKIAERLEGDSSHDSYNMSIANCNRHIATLPQNALLYFHRGVVYARMGEYAKAAEDLKAALKINPGHALAKRWLETVDKKVKGGAGTGAPPVPKKRF